jgi:hypothetical protein
VPISYHYQMEVHLGLLPYPKENDTSEEVSLISLFSHHNGITNRQIMPKGDFQKK